MYTHYSLYFLLLIIIAWVYFSQPKIPKQVAKPECPLLWPYTECMSSLDIYVSLKPEAIKILKLCVFLIVIFLLGLLHLDFNQVLRHEKQSVQYTSHFSIHSMQAMAFC